MLPYLVYLWVFFCHIYPITRIRGPITWGVLRRYVLWVINVWLIAPFGYRIICLLFAVRAASAPSSRLQQSLSGIAECARRSSMNSCNSQEYQCALVQRECWALARCLSQSRKQTIVIELVREYYNQYEESFYWLVGLVSLYVLLMAKFAADVATNNGHGTTPGPPPSPGQEGAGPVNENQTGDLPAVPVNRNPAGDPPAVPANRNPAGNPPAGPVNGTGRRQPPPRRQVAPHRRPLLARDEPLTETELQQLPGHPRQTVRLWRSGTYAEAVDDNLPGDPIHGREAVGILRVHPTQHHPSGFRDDNNRQFVIRTRANGAVLSLLDAARILEIRRRAPPYNPLASPEDTVGNRQRETLRGGGVEPELVDGGEFQLTFTGRLTPYPIPGHPAAFRDSGNRFWVMINSRTREPISVAGARLLLRIREWERRNSEGDENSPERGEGLVWDLDTEPVAPISPENVFRDPPNADDPNAITEERLQRYNLRVRWYQGEGAVVTGNRRPVGRLEQPIGDALPDPRNHWVDDEGRMFMIQAFRYNELTRENYHYDLTHNEVLDRLSQPPPERHAAEQLTHHRNVTREVRDLWDTPQGRAYLTTRYDMWPALYDAALNAEHEFWERPRQPARLPQGRLVHYTGERQYRRLLVDEAGFLFWFYTRGEIPVDPQDVLDLFARVLPGAREVRTFFEENEEAQNYLLVEGGLFPIIAVALNEESRHMIRLPDGPLRRSDLDANIGLIQYALRDRTNRLFYIVNEDNIIQHPQDVLNFIDRYPSFIPRRVVQDMQTYFESNQEALGHILVQDGMFPVPWETLQEGPQPMRLPQGFLERIPPGQGVPQETPFPVRLEPFVMRDEAGTNFLVYGRDGHAIDPDTIIAFNEAFQTRNALLDEWDRLSAGTNNFVTANRVALFSLAHHDPEDPEPRIHQGDLVVDQSDRSYFLDGEGTRFRIYRREPYALGNGTLASSNVQFEEVMAWQTAFHERRNAGGGQPAQMNTSLRGVYR